MKTEMTRRDFLQKSSLIVAVSALPGELIVLKASSAQAGMTASFKPHAF